MQFEDVYKALKSKAGYYKKRGLDADDIMQDAILRMIDSGYNFDNVENLSSFALSYLDKVVLKTYRSKAINNKHLQKYQSNHDNVEYNIDHETQDLIETYMSILNNQEREILRMYYLDGMNDNEVAEKINCNSKTVNKVRRKSLEKIRHHFNIEKNDYNKEQQIISDLKAGLSINSITRMRNVSIRTVTKIANDIGIERKPTKKIVAIPKDQLINMLRKHNGVVIKAAKEIGYASPFTVTKWIKNYNIDLNALKGAA